MIIKCIGLTPILLLLLLLFPVLAFAHTNPVMYIFPEERYPIGAGGFRVRVGPKVGYLSGDTSYEITFPWDGDTGKSRLDFPLDTFVAGVDVSIGTEVFSLNLEGLMPFQEKTYDEMKDKDWVVGYLPWSSTESDAQIEALIWDVNLLYKFWYESDPYRRKEGWAGVLVGYRFQKFEYDIYDVYDMLDGGNKVFSGRCLEYEVEYRIPYIGIKSCYIKDRDPGYWIDRWGVEAKLCYTSYVEAEDEDDHILRNKISRGDCDGWGLLLGMNAIFEAKSNWTFRVGVDYIKIETDGTQDQYWYADETWTDEFGVPQITPAGTHYTDIDDEIELNQGLLWFRIGYRF